MGIIQEVFHFLARHPSPEEILAFRPSTSAVERLNELLDKNRAGTLTSQEGAELDAMESLNHLIALIKGRAWQHLPAAA